MTPIQRLGTLGLLWLAPLVCAGQVTCSIHVYQDDREVTPLGNSLAPIYVLKAAEFRIEVLPSACSPTIATLPSNELAMQIAQKPIIYADRLFYVVAANPTDGDKLLWWAPKAVEQEFLAAPDPNTFAGKQYLKLCEELKFCPIPYPIYSSAHPFVESPTGSKSVANFKRLDDTRALSAAKGKGLINVIYTLWRRLPSEYPMADPRALLFRPNLVLLKFLED